MSETIDWALARTVASRVSGTDPFAESYHAASLESDFERLTAEAQQHVELEVGFGSLAGPARAKVVDRSDWVAANIASYRRLLRPVLGALEERMTGPVAMVSGKIAGAEMGALLGWMSSRVLGQYDLLVLEDEDPEDQDLVYYVGPNILALEKKHSFLGLVEQLVGMADPDPGRFFVALGRIAEWVRTGENPLEEGGLSALFASEEQRAVMERVGGLMSLLEGHGDVVMDRAAVHLVPQADRFGKVLRARRKEMGVATKMVQRLIGLEAKLNQYERGERFIEVVEADGGPGLLNRAFEQPENLPTMAEIDEPEQWLARIGPAAAAAG
jgi:uncharacterized protein (DUF2342 family)